MYIYMYIYIYVYIYVYIYIYLHVAQRLPERGLQHARLCVVQRQLRQLSRRGRRQNRIRARVSA